ncbi:NAD(P)/FAD-dependent oxidoreductase [Taklimakanibacter deserti]|uniref:NAD(P)/FAD-dependent oxidoreductase n=1 Tax=Taklimakanibacter deserti TaxID=2267839 RepID=UPI000E655D27
MTSDIVVIDRHQPQTASTSLLQWELDTPLRDLATKLGPEKSIQIYHARAEAVRNTRDRKIGAKAQTIMRKFARPYPGFDAEAEFAWSGFFGVADDGLPLIGALPGHPHVFAAFGYGGNGITFSAMAARLIAEAISDCKNPLLECFSVDRD